VPPARALLLALFLLGGGCELTADAAAGAASAVVSVPQFVTE
jgi:hypothetical protein